MAQQLPFKVKARYGWSGQTKDDLGFLEGDIMEVTRLAGDWYYGRLLRNKKCSGYFPHNYVTLIEERINRSVENSPSVSRTSSSHEKLEQEPNGVNQKVSLPPVPSRSRNGSSSDLRSKSSSPIPYRQSRTLDTIVRPSRKLKDSLQKHAPSHAKLYEHGHPVSSPDLQLDKQTSKPFTPDTRDSHLRRTTRNRTGRKIGNTLPPLPPLPDNSSPNDNSKRRVPTKSYSYNDISLNHSKDYNFYKDNQKFYDGYGPERHSNGNSSEFHNPSSYSNASTDSAGIFSNSRYLETSVTDSENSFALMSDFSATSAGSFARHKYAESFSDSLERSQTQSTYGKQVDTNAGSNNGRMGGLLRKILPKSSTANEIPRLPTIENLNISVDNDARDWVAVKSQVNRSRTLTKYEKHPRYMRTLEENRDLVLHPQDSIYNGLNTNEIKPGGQNGLVNVMLTELNCEYIDSMTRKRCSKDGKMKLDSWAQMTFSARYSSPLEILRGIYIFCTETFELVDDNSNTDFSSEPPNIDSILHDRYCTPYELTWLFKKLANALGITCEIVIGFLKTPGSNNCEFKYNHCWLRTLISREWRFVDVILGNITNPIHEFINNRKRKFGDDSYFLVEPLEFIYTHIPPREFEQHIVPIVDQLSVLYLPLVFPSFFKNNLKLYNYSTALAYLEDSEIYECTLEIPNDIEVFTSVVIPTDNQSKTNEYRQMELTLTQIKKHKSNPSRRLAILKAVLPLGASNGTLYIHSGVRGTQPTRANIHPLSMVVPLQHKGAEIKYEFAVRIPSENLQKVELYIKEPQNRYLYKNNEYTFEIIQNPFDGVVYNKIENSQRKIQPVAVRSPSGKIYELNKEDANQSYGIWSKVIMVKEEGIWAGLATADSGLGWSPFAEWVCM